MTSDATPRVLRLPRGRALALARVPLVMGIVNVTPDSFSDGGAHFDRDCAVEAALRMVSDGAAIVDVGGESTRPGSDPVPIATEIERVVPVIEGIRNRSDVPISIDTRNARVAEAALRAGADLVNDVSALRHDSDMRPLVASAGVPAVLMHMRGAPKTMQQEIRFERLMPEIIEELTESLDAAVAAGIDRAQLLVDPGIGFGKTFDHNLEILARCEELAALAPFLIGASRKAFIGQLTGRPAGPERAVGSLATVAAAFDGGAAVVRVHDVRETVDFLTVHAAIRAWRA